MMKFRKSYENVTHLKNHSKLFCNIIDSSFDIQCTFATGV